MSDLDKLYAMVKQQKGRMDILFEFRHQFLYPAQYPWMQAVVLVIAGITALGDVVRLSNISLGASVQESGENTVGLTRIGAICGPLEFPNQKPRIYEPSLLAWVMDCKQLRHRRQATAAAAVITELELDLLLFLVLLLLISASPSPDPNPSLNKRTMARNDI